MKMMFSIGCMVQLGKQENRKFTVEQVLFPITLTSCTLYKIFTQKSFRMLFIFISMHACKMHVQVKHWNCYIVKFIVGGSSKVIISLECFSV